MGRREIEKVDLEYFSKYAPIHSKKETALKFGLVVKDVAILMKRLNLKHNSKVWYTNGDCNLFLYEGNEVPVGFYKGRVSKQTTTKGRMWVTNGRENRLVSFNDIPLGFRKGLTSIKTSGYKTYNNGVSNLVISPEEEIPFGFKLGRVGNENYKKAASKRKIVLYNDGEFNYKGKYIPNGCFEGWLTKKQLRDIEYKKLGYVPLSNIRHLYSAYVYLKSELDIIELKGPYTYIKETEVEKLEEYSKNNHSKGTSFTEQLIVNCIKEVYKDDVYQNTKKVITPLELDIYIPKLKLAVEYNGTYWHSSLPKDYHLNKSLLCRERGIGLIHIYEFEDFDNQLNILKQLILGNDLYPKNDFNKNNLIKEIPEQEVIFSKDEIVIYGAGILF